MVLCNSAAVVSVVKNGCTPVTGFTVAAAPPVRRSASCPMGVPPDFHAVSVKLSCCHVRPDPSLAGMAVRAVVKRSGTLGPLEVSAAKPGATASNDRQRARCFIRLNLAWLTCLFKPLHTLPLQKACTYQLHATPLFILQWQTPHGWRWCAPSALRCCRRPSHTAHRLIRPQSGNTR